MESRNDDEGGRNAKENRDRGDAESEHNYERQVHLDEEDEEEDEDMILPVRLTTTPSMFDHVDSHNGGEEDHHDDQDGEHDSAERHEAEEAWARTLERLRREATPPLHLVAIDGSSDSDRAFSWAVRTLPRHDKLLLVYGTRRVPLPGLEMTLLERRSAVEHQLRLRRKARALAQHYARRCAEEGMECYFQRVEYWGPNDLATQICRAADVHEARTVIAGSRGLGAMQRFVLGSVSTGLLHHCHPTVVIAREPRNKEHTIALDLRNG